MTTPQRPKLYCEEAGTKDGKGSIILLHGGFGSGAGDFRLNIPYLEQDYHLILPDLPGHGKSQHIRPYSAPYAAELVADAVRERARNGRAHVIGFSMGMSVAMDLISKYPEVVNDVFMTGYKRIPYSSLLPYGFWLSEKITDVVPRPVMRWLMDGTDSSSSSSSSKDSGPVTPSSISLSREIMKPAYVDEKGEAGWPDPWPARTLIMCAGKAGVLPTADHPDAAVKLREIARRMNPGTVAYTHPLMRHPWLWQDPKLFADTARMWFEEGKVPEGFVEL